MAKEVITRKGQKKRELVAASNVLNKPANVEFMREELKRILPQYVIVADCVDGELAVKAKKTAYLPQPNPDDDSEENAARYLSYLLRAVFYNVTKRTLAGLLGTVFTREPVTTVPTKLDIVVKDANGGGIDLIQTAKKATSLTLQFGRAGAFADYPSLGTDEAGNVILTTQADIDAGNIRPTITIYEPKDIVNWRIFSRGGKQLLSLVVLREDFAVHDDGFEQKLVDQYRVLSIDEAGLYKVDVWQKAGTWGIISTSLPTDANGKRLDEIPFTFIGVEDNSPNIDSSPLYDLASLNIAHYRNSADYEESSYLVGQPTPYFAGLTENWVTNVLKGTITLGSRGAVPLPEGGSAGLLQADPNTMPKEAMEMKEKQMVALGAKLVEQKEVQRTATEADIENASELSTLSSVAQNVAAAIKFCLEWCGIFVGIGETGIEFKLNTEFDLTRMSPEERKQLVAEWQQGAITFTEMRNNLRRGGIATEDDDKAKTEIANDLQNSLDLTEPTQPATTATTATTATKKTTTTKTKVAKNA